MPILTFVVPLQSPDSSKDWKSVEKLCQRTLRSICSQTCSDFKVILVCNKAPRNIIQLAGLQVVEETFPIPGPTSAERMNDKWLKVKRGLVEARQNGPGYIMICDADDCVSNQLAEFCERSPRCAGWSLDRAFIHDEGSSWLFLRDGFARLCGTSAMVWAEPHELPSSMDDPIDRYFLLCHGHGVISDFLSSVGRPLAPLPFPGAVYCTGTGENDSGFRFADWRSRKLLLQKIFNARFLNRKRVQEFGLFPLETP
jgi:hypothetical protein